MNTSRTVTGATATALQKIGEVINTLRSVESDDACDAFKKFPELLNDFARAMKGIGIGVHTREKNEAYLAIGGLEATVSLRAGNVNEGRMVTEQESRVAGRVEEGSEGPIAEEDALVVGGDGDSVMEEAVETNEEGGWIADGARGGVALSGSNPVNTNENVRSVTQRRKRPSRAKYMPLLENSSLAEISAILGKTVTEMSVVNIDPC
ncbi:hypothetical protein BX666DRAFT_2033810 [Dichotomocladium elegans]|nr:hypothetical protein BX666DRAFT_2033810 [Dichotomocladium elegans]